MKNNLKEKGKLLIKSQYPIVPLTKGLKYPTVKNWQKLNATNDDVDKWLANGHAVGAGVGILASKFPAIDIDIYDEEAANLLIAEVQNKYGITLIRTGQAPKVLIPFRLADGAPPMKKRKSAIYIDLYGDIHAVEMLGDGQQYVAYHEHPVTKQQYSWANGRGLAEVLPEDLPVLTSEIVDYIFDFVDQLAERFQWDLKDKASGGGTVAAANDDGFDFEDVSPKCDMTVDEVSKSVMLVPNDDLHYDQWVDVGMAIVHELGKCDQAYEIWDEWSQNSGKYDDAQMQLKWRSFKEYKGGASITMRTVIKLGNEAEYDRQDSELERLLRRIETTDDRRMLTKTIPREIADASLDNLMFEDLVSALRAQYKKVTGRAVAIGVARLMCNVRGVANAVDSGEGLEWLDNFLFLRKENKFFCKDTKETLTTDSFDHCYDRNFITANMLADGQFVPLVHASNIAMNVKKIPRCKTTMYAPGLPEVFALDDRPDVMYANSYRPHNITAVKAKDRTPEEQDTIDRVERVLQLVSHDVIDQRLFRQWLSYVATHLGAKTLGWSFIMQGAQGSGKTFFHEMMSSVLGVQNTRVINAKELEGKFTAWSEGSSFASVEEIRLHGKNKWDVMNSMKPYITNSMVSVERKGRDAMDVINTISYLFFTQFKDSAPIEESDRRLYPIFSKLQTLSDVAAFNAEMGENWWTETFAAVRAHGGALLGWMEETDLSDFNPSKAPKNRAKQQMIELARSEEELFVADLLADETKPHISRTLLMTKDVSDEAMLSDEPLDLVTRSMSRVLSTLGLDRVVRLKIDNEVRTLWSGDKDVVKMSKKELRALYFDQKAKLLGIAKPDDFAK